jgi:hypothetical protein
MKRDEESIQHLVVNPEGKRLRVIPGHGRENHFQIYVEEIVSENVDWIYLAQDRVRWWAVVNAVMSLRIP